MILTNKFNLPITIYEAVKNDYYQKEGQISVTALNDSPRIVVLRARHWSEITEDCSDRIWSLVGQAVHEVLRRTDTKNVLKEERLSMMVNGWKLSGQFDIFDGETLWDYKIVGLFSYKMGIKKEWEAQGNIYRYMIQKLLDFEVKHIRYCCIIRDWMSSKTNDPTYPQCQVQVIEIPIWSDEQTEKYIDERVKLHQEASNLEDDLLPVCTSDERWERPTIYAVMKKGGKRSTANFDNETDALEYIKDNEVKNAEVVERPGGNTRCERFCQVKQWCSFWRELYGE